MDEIVDNSDQSGNSLVISREGETSRVVTARGTEDGLVLRIDGRAGWESILEEVRSFLGTRRRFLEGGQISVEWLDRLPTKEQSSELETFLRDDYGIAVVGRRRRPAYTMITVDGKNRREKKGGHTVALFGDEEHQDEPAKAEQHAGERRYTLEEAMEVLEHDSRNFAQRMAKVLGDDVPYEEDANAKVVYATFRSGQRIETPFSLIVVGDVNPGADLVAGGDIIVLGSLRGTAHAGAYDDEAQGHVIIALHMQPMQLRIGSVISRGNDELSKGAEIARIENRRIVVESFSPRAFLGRKSRM